MKWPALVLTAVVVPVLMAPARAEDKGNPSRTEQVEASARKIKELQAERVATLKKATDGLEHLYQTGRASYEAVLKSRLQLLRAELDTAEKESDRVALYKTTVDVLKNYEKIAVARYEAGRDVEATILTIKARRLEVEIQLEKAKIKAAKEGK